MVSNRQREIRITLLARAISEDESVFFPLMVVVDEESSASFTATIAGLENSVLACGISEDDAAQDAIETFQEIVDAAIDMDLPLTKVLRGGPFKRAAIPISRTHQVFEKLHELVKAKMEQHDGWSRIDTSDQFVPLLAEA